MSLAGNENLSVCRELGEEQLSRTWDAKEKVSIIVKSDTDYQAL